MISKQSLQCTTEKTSNNSAFSEKQKQKSYAYLASIDGGENNDCPPLGALPKKRVTCARIDIEHNAKIKKNDASV